MSQADGGPQPTSDGSASVGPPPRLNGITPTQVASFMLDVGGRLLLERQRADPPPTGDRRPPDAAADEAVPDEGEGPGHRPASCSHEASRPRKWST